MRDGFKFRAGTSAESGGVKKRKVRLVLKSTDRVEGDFKVLEEILNGSVIY